MLFPGADFPDRCERAATTGFRVAEQPVRVPV
jgi:hypothetical protein